MEVKIKVAKVETVEIDKEILKERCKQIVLDNFEDEFERCYKNNGYGDIEIYVNVSDVISDLIDDEYDDWDFED